MVCLSVHMFYVVAAFRCLISKVPMLRMHREQMGRMPVLLLGMLAVSTGMEVRSIICSHELQYVLAVSKIDGSHIPVHGPPGLQPCFPQPQGPVPAGCFHNLVFGHCWKQAQFEARKGQRTSFCQVLIYGGSCWQVPQSFDFAPRNT